MLKTKIICTLGPSTDDDNVLRELIKKGMNVARLNFSHGDHAEQLGRLNRLKRLREESLYPVATIMDTKGPEIRIKQFEGNKA
ncbi:MAG TPA: pyruvate kinase, partial [Oscillospiraceae bacterium]|nr:pyruvate kinase [Oscillospiraceae bacterium]